MTELGPLDYKPRKSQIGAWVGAIVFAGSFFGLSFTLGNRTAGGGTITWADHAGMIGLGLIGGGVILMFLRLRVRADERGVEIRNIGSTKFLPWEIVTGVNFSAKSQWATVEIADDDEISVMAIQISDKDRAVAAVKHLRALMEQSRRS